MGAMVEFCTLVKEDEARSRQLLSSPWLVRNPSGLGVNPPDVLHELIAIGVTREPIDGGYFQVSSSQSGSYPRMTKALPSSLSGSFARVFLQPDNRQ